MRTDEVQVDLAGETFGLDLVDGAGRDARRRCDTTTSMSPRSPVTASANAADGAGVGDVERVHDRLAARLADLRGDLVAPVDASRAQRHRVTDRGQGQRGRGTDAGRGAGDHGRATLGLVIPAHQRTATVTGSAAKPRTLVECTRTARPWSTSRVRTRRTSSRSATRASSRARLAPRQKCRPPPKLSSWASSALSRWMSKSSGRLKTRSSRLAEPRTTSSLAPFGRHLAVQRDVREQVPGDHLAGGVEAQGLLDPRLDQAGVRAPREDGRELFGVLREVEQRVAEQLGRGLVARHDHQEEEGDDLLVGEPVTVDALRSAARWSGRRWAAFAAGPACRRSSR